MALETITREEFDPRLDAANARLAQQLQEKENKQSEVEQLLSQYERALDRIEAELDEIEEKPSARVLLRNRLNKLAEKTAQVAASL